MNPQEDPNHPKKSDDENKLTNAGTLEDTMDIYYGVYFGKNRKIKEKQDERHIKIIDTLETPAFANQSKLVPQVLEDTNFEDDNNACGSDHWSTLLHKLMVNQEAGAALKVIDTLEREHNEKIARMEKSNYACEYKPPKIWFPPELNVHLRKDTLSTKDHSKYFPPIYTNIKCDFRKLSTCQTTNMTDQQGLIDGINQNKGKGKKGKETKMKKTSKNEIGESSGFLDPHWFSHPETTYVQVRNRPDKKPLCQVIYGRILINIYSEDELDKVGEYYQQYVQELSTEERREEFCDKIESKMELEKEKGKKN